MDLVERVARLIEERRTVRRFFGRRAIDKSCGEVVHDTDPDGPISDATMLVIERIDLPNFQGEAAAAERAAELYDEYTARAAIAAVLEWQPIETAPKDGTQMLCVAPFTKPDGGTTWAFPFYGVAQWAEADPDFPKSVAGWFWPYATRPTHWLPLPTPPSDGQG